MPYFDITVIGGDRKMTYLIPLLRDKGYRVSAYGIPMNTEEEKRAAQKAFLEDTMEKAVKNSRMVVAGIPFRKNDPLFQKGIMIPGQVLVCGGIDRDTKEDFEKKKIKVVDLMESEMVRMENSVATAEGVVAELLYRIDQLVYGLEILVFGYGKCGSLIVDRMQGMCGKVTVISRNPVEKAIAKSRGISCLDLKTWQEQGYLSKQDQVWINTMPVENLEIETAKKRSGKRENPILFFDITGKLKDPKAIYLKGLPGQYRARAMAKSYAEEITYYHCCSIPDQ